MEQPWKNYEDVAAHLLNLFADEFGFDFVEGKQTIQGSCGTQWEIDAKACRDHQDGFLIVECRRKTTSRISQEQAGALAFRIQDTGAEGGIFVTPIGLQKGAKMVAAAENIETVTLSPNSTPHEFLMRFLHKVMVGIRDSCAVSDRVIIKKVGPGDQ